MLRNNALSKYNLGSSELEKDFKKKYKKYKMMAKKSGVRIHNEENYNARVRYIVELRASEDRLRESLTILNNVRVSQGKQPIIMDSYCDIL